MMAMAGFPSGSRLCPQSHQIQSGYFYSASSSPLLLRGAPDTARILFRSFTQNRHRQMRVKDLLKANTWQLERDSNPRPCVPLKRNSSNLPMSHHTLQMYVCLVGKKLSHMDQAKTLNINSKC